LGAVVCALVWHQGSLPSAAPRQGVEQSFLEAKTGSGARLGPLLLALSKAASASRDGRLESLRRKLPMLRIDDGYVTVSARGDDLPSLRGRLVSNGMVESRLHERAVSGRVPIRALREIAATPGLKLLDPELAVTNAGVVTTQGDRAMRTDDARVRFGVDGSGVRVGVLSDSFDCAPGPFFPGDPFTRAADDVASGDLPADVRVLADLAEAPNAACSDEGRAMMQLIHDVAPGASLSFHTAFGGRDDFAAGILALADDGAQIIVDDVIYYGETMFEDGVIADAVDEVTRRGVAYFAAAGNFARQSYAAPFRSSGRYVERSGYLGLRHDFDRGPGVDDLQQVTAPPGTVTLLSFQWDEPSMSANGKRGSRSDVDVVFHDANEVFVEICSDDPAQLVCQVPGQSYNVGRDAVEIAFIINLSDQPRVFQLGIELFEGPAPQFVKYVWSDQGFAYLALDEFATDSSTIYGHFNAAGAETVGAASWYDTAAWGAPFEPRCVPACLEYFSSAGGTPVWFGRNGERLRVAEIRAKPGVIGPDGGNTTFLLTPLLVEVPGSTEPDAFPNFFGTSASAPHVAGLAALMIDQWTRQSRTAGHDGHPRRLTPAMLKSAIRRSALDMKYALRLDPRTFEVSVEEVPGSRGFDFETGFGFVDGRRAMKLIIDARRDDRVSVDGSR
jgi:subtilisin family serine protease